MLPTAPTEAEAAPVTDPKPGPETGSSETSWFQRLDDWHERWFMGRWRRAIRADAQQHDDILHAVALLEAIGIENPMAYETLDALPYLINDFHQWHQRMGRPDYGNPAVCC